MADTGAGALFPILDPILDFTFGLMNQGKVDAQAQETANILTANAKEIDRQAIEAIAKGDWQAAQINRQAGAVEGGQRAAFAASGLSLGSGGLGDLLDETQTMSELDMLTAKRTALATARGMKTEANNLRTKAKMVLEGADLAKQQAFLAGGASIVSGGARALEYYDQMSRLKAKPTPEPYPGPPPKLYGIQ